MPGMKFVDVNLDKKKLHTFLNTSKSGDSLDLWKYLESKKRKAVNGAQRMVGVKTGALRASIGSTHTSNTRGQYVNIFATAPHALMHHEGTKPHVIVPTNGKMLRFTHGRQTVYTTRVMHPGTRANPYLSRQLIHFVG